MTGLDLKRGTSESRSTTSGVLLKHGLKKLLLLSVALIAAGLYFVWNWFDRPTTWKEEVQLQGGDLILVTRTIRFQAYQPIGGTGGGSDIPESRLQVTSPVRADNPTPWSYPTLLPMILDRDPVTGEWFIVATFYMCTAWYDLGRPKLPYAEFRYRNKQWVRQPLSSSLIGREANMLIPNQADVKRDHTISSKEGLMNNPSMSARHKHVVASWTTHC